VVDIGCLTVIGV